MKIIITIIVLLILAGLLGWRVWAVKQTPQKNHTTTSESTPAKPIQTEQVKSVIEPTDNFLARITKKPFGIYVSPKNSPVSPERFTGYHTGADGEYTDIAADVPVRSVADGEILSARTASGYGGVMVVRHSIDNKKIITIYGHLDPKSFTDKKSVKQGDQLGILGEGYTAETDFERKHLHLGMLKGEAVDLRGYVQAESELANWYNPVDFFK